MHFYGTILYVNKSTHEKPSVYDVELVQDTNYSIEIVDEAELKNLVFISFSINDNYKPILINHANTSETVDEQKVQQTMQSVMPILRGFMSAISD